jgi:flagellar M-ring protein FliF
VLAESGLFKKSSQKPKASITLAMRDNRGLQPEQVIGIQRLVAASVPQIDPSAVTVLDQRGVTLSRNVDPDNEDAAVALGSKNELEAYLTRKVVLVLDKAFGPGSAIVSVDVTLNHEQVRTTREDVLPHARGMQATRAITRQRTSVQAPAAAPAMAAAVGEQPIPARAVASNSEIEYQNSRLVEQTVSRPGSVRRISVGVLLPQTLEAAKLREMTQVLSMAVGLNAARGDEIAISALDRFPGAAVALKAKSDAMAELTGRPPADNPGANGARTVSMALIAILAVLAVLLVGAMALLGARRKRQVAPLTASERERLLAQMRRWLGAQEG